MRHRFERMPRLAPGVKSADDNEGFESMFLE